MRPPSALRPHTRSTGVAVHRSIVRSAMCAVLAGMVATLGACAHRGTVAPGVRFAVRAEDRLVGVTNGEIPLVTEAEARIEVFEPARLGGPTDVVRAEETTPVAILGASTTNEAVVRVVRTDMNSFDIQTGRAGTAAIEVVTSGWTHALPIVVAEPSRVEMSYATPDLERTEPPILVLAEGNARFRLRRLDAMGRVLGGTTLSAPAFVEPRGAGTVTMRPGDRDIVDVRFAAPGHAVIRTPGGRPLEVDVVTQAELTMLDLAAVEAPGRTHPVTELAMGSRQLVVLRAYRADGQRVHGLDSLTTLTTATPETCTLEDVSRYYADGAYVLVGRGSGACRLTATLGAQTVTAEVTVH